MASASTVENMISNNYHHVLEEILRCAQSVNRDPSTIRLIVVTKTHPIDTIQQIIDAGARYLGENYVEDAVAKIKAIRCEGLQWHMIGHVQSRKAQAIPLYFHILHSLDSLKLGLRLNRFASEAKHKLPVLLQFNVSGEENKSGWVAWEEGKWNSLLPEIEEILSFNNLEVRGLMTIPPFFSDPESSRPYFVRLRRLQDFLAHHYPQASWNELSMGMSGDYKVAVEEGATWVRIGQAILGPRS